MEYARNVCRSRGQGEFALMIVHPPPGTSLEQRVDCCWLVLIQQKQERRQWLQCSERKRMRLIMCLFLCLVPNAQYPPPPSFLS